MAEQFEFLTPEWVEAAHKIREEFEGKVAAPAHVVKMNQVVTDVPFQDEDIQAFMDTADGNADMGLGHLPADEVDLTVTVDYETAKAIMVDGNPQAGMQAFMAGKIKVEGDMTKMMALQQGSPDPAAQEMAERIKEMTV
ncbi:MAG: SCP2 sterol-binding domain-containing protein [Acidimicrobiales bacterium]